MDYYSLLYIKNKTFLLIISPTYISFIFSQKFLNRATISCFMIFSGCSLLSSLPNISKWNTNKVTNMSCMFYGCSSLKSLPDISK